MPSLDTKRTIIRPFRLSDAEEAFGWLGDPEVMRYIPLGADSAIDDTKGRISRYIDHQNIYGFSKWVIVDRETHRLIGDSGFYNLPEKKGVELGYRLSRPYWGRGLATEVARRWIEVASDFTNESSLFAFAHPDNSSSFRVMNKLGFKFSRNEEFYGVQAPLFELSLKATKGQ
jgi:[ribosomal protein S5]-alanine N-acetyltransferase